MTFHQGDRFVLNVTRREWLGAVVIELVAIVLTWLPYALGYALTQFPMFALMGLWGRAGWTQRAIIYPSVALGLYLSAQFFLWGWVA